MTISYEIILTIINLTNDLTKTFTKSFNFELNNLPDDKIYNNHHIIANNVSMFNLFKEEINDYCLRKEINVNNIDIDEFNLNSLTNRVDIYFESDDNDPSLISLEPNIKCYIYPKFEELTAPILEGKAYDDTTIIWSWEDDGQAHYIVSEAIDLENEEDKDKIVAQIPTGINTFTETGLEPDTEYTRRIITYNLNQTSNVSHATTVFTAQAPIDQSLERYSIPKNYDYTSDDSERDIIDERLEAFHSGVGDYNDLKVYKQMDADFYQKFKAYIQLRGARIEREKRYDTVGFNYKVCLEAEETVEEQKGEVTFDIDVYPIENISIKDYMYAIQPVEIYSRMWCDVLLKKKTEENKEIEVPLEEPEWSLDEQPNIPNKYIRAKWVKANIIMVLDVTNSLRDTYARYSEDENNGAYKRCVKELGHDIRDHFVKPIKKALGSNVKFKVIKFGSSGHYEGDESVLDNLNQANIDAGLTCWASPLSMATSYKKGGKWQNILFFFSDGGCNYAGDGDYPFSGQTHYIGGNPANGLDSSFRTKLINSIDNATSNYDYISTFIYMLNRNGNDDSEAIQGGTSQSPIKFTQGYLKKCDHAIRKHASQSEWHGWKKRRDLVSGITAFLTSFYSGAHYVIPQGCPGAGTDVGDMPFCLPDGTPTYDEKRSEGFVFNGWVSTDKKITINTSYNIDDTKWAHICIPPLDQDPWITTIDETVTPVVYARNEQRAIIPSDSILIDRNFDPSNTIGQPALKVCDTDIQTLILNEVQNTPEWNAGYNEVVQALTQDEQKQGQYIIRGLFIKDSYKYADEDKIPDISLTSQDPLEDGYVGSINVYADINKLQTDAYSDDVYAVGSDKYVWMSGYTDAIIYDGEHIESFDLNASHAETYDHQTEVLISPYNNTYQNLMWNRKNNTLQYTGSSGKIYHIVDIIYKDKDIYITGSQYLHKEGDWAMIVPPGTNINNYNNLIRGVTYPQIEVLNTDIIAHNDEHYQSPILNYRFNYEDPDAYTSYYEILPTCDPLSSFKNIVLLHIYYARNIYIQDENKLSGSSTQYIDSFGDDNIATRASNYYLNNDKILGQTYFRDDYIDDYLWFQAKPHMETRPYYDEKPNPGMDTLYGNVNGRYREDNKSGKFDLRVITPQFNIPTTVNPSDIRIYIMISEFYPDTALVSYKWEHPYDLKNSITKVNGDYVTFSSDSLTYKDVVYNDLIQTITTRNIELFDNKTKTEFFIINKPLTRYIYDHYYINLFSNNADVMILNYPNEIVFNESDKAEFGANFKGVVNATTKWSPRIHNGYYYLNQHEYYAYSEFNVEANFEEYNDENYKTITGYLTIDVDLLRKAGPPEHYDITKDVRSELIQNEEEFIWILDKGLTIRPSIDGQYYKEYTAHLYTSPVIIFPNVLTSANRLKVDYYYEDGSDDLLSDDLPMEVRCYLIEEGKWSDWVNFVNNTVPNIPLSCAYQVRFTLTATTNNHDKSIEDYLCCYLDWVDDGDTDSHVNCVTITDHLQAGPYESDGIFNSKIIDFGCETTISLDMFESNINKSCELYIAIEHYNKDKLLLENIHWTRINDKGTITTRFLRYRIVIPYGEKVYWLHKNIITKETDVILPYITSISMSGDYVPTDTHDSFQEVQSFEITTDGQRHRIFASIYNIISSDIKAKGFEDNEIRLVKINSTQFNINLEYDKYIKNEYPSVSILNTPIYAIADFETEISVKYTPYIYADRDEARNLDVITITKGTPQQYAPITMENTEGNLFKEIFDVDSVTLQKTEKFEVLDEDSKHYIKLSRNDFDIKTLSLLLNEGEFNNYKITNNLIIFNDLLNIGDNITVKYNILNSFYTEIDYDNDKTKITIYNDYDSEIAKDNELDNIKPITVANNLTEFKFDQLHTTGSKIYFDRNARDTDHTWKYNVNLSAIYYPENNDYFSIITHNMLPSAYYECKVTAYSKEKDNDVIGFVVGAIKDSGGKLHTLSYLVSFGNDYVFNGNNIALVIDYGTNDAVILDTRQVNHDNYIYWNELPNGIVFNIKKYNDMVHCKISYWNNINEFNNDSFISIDLKQNELTQLFNQTVSYGFCVRSQGETYFTDPIFNGKIDRSIDIEEQIQKLRRKYKVYFETNKVNNKFIASSLSMNPVYRTDYKGFIYLTDDHNEPYKINIYRNPKYIKAGGYDKIDITIEVLDFEDNPVISKDIDIDCKYGILNFDNNDAQHLTDINGVIHVLYESAVEKCSDILTAITTTSDGDVIKSSVDIINE